MLTRLGLQIPSFTFPDVAPDAVFDTVAAIAATAESSGFDSLWVMDHFFQIPGVGGLDEPMFEAYTLLGALAARTTRVRLGALVTGVTYRNPALVAKQVTTLDVLSGGRAVLGIGAAWFEREHEGLGFTFPPLAERFARLEEALQLCRAMFTQDTTSFQGRYYQLRDAPNRPAPLQPGGPPILVGGSGERRTLRLVAKYADACNLFGDPATIRHKLAVLERHCADVGRDPATITKTRLGTLCIADTDEEARRRAEPLRQARGMTAEAFEAMVTVGSPQTVAERAAELLATGLDGLVFNLVGAGDLDTVALAGRTLATAVPAAGTDR